MPLSNEQQSKGESTLPRSPSVPGELEDSDLEDSDLEDSDLEEDSVFEDSDPEEPSEERGGEAGSSSNLDSEDRDSSSPRPRAAESPTDLKLRLSAFLPQIRKANAELEDGGVALAKQIDHVADDEERYIEMNLGLGVLSQRKKSEDVKLASSSSSSSGEESESEDHGAPREEDVMASLKGDVLAKGTKRRIEEVG